MAFGEGTDRARIPAPPVREGGLKQRLMALQKSSCEAMSAVERIEDAMGAKVPRSGETRTQETTRRDSVEDMVTDTGLILRTLVERLQALEAQF